MPQLNSAQRAALLEEAEQEAGGALQTPDFCLNAETFKANFLSFVTHRLFFGATDVRQATGETTH